MILISPAKKMKLYKGSINTSTPFFIKNANTLVRRLREYSIEEIKEKMKVSEKIANENFLRYKNFNKKLSPAILTYSGIQYKYQGIDSYNKFIDENVRILSALYGILKPYDEISEYRLDFSFKDLDLYNYWKKDINKYLEGKKIINLTSKEYEKMFYSKELDIINISFKIRKGSKLKSLATYSKILRGLMIKYLAQNNSLDIEVIKSFNQEGYIYNEKESKEKELVFIKEE